MLTFSSNVLIALFYQFNRCKKYRFVFATVLPNFRILFQIWDFITIIAEPKTRSIEQQNSNDQKGHSGTMIRMFYTIVC